MVQEPDRASGSHPNAREVRRGDERHRHARDSGSPPRSSSKGTPHDFRRTVANATALLGHADEGTTVRHYVEQTHVAQTCGSSSTN